MNELSYDDIKDEPPQYYPENDIPYHEKSQNILLENLVAWLYEEGIKFEKICDSEREYINAIGVCARRAQCYYTIQKIDELRQQADL
jgi:hypothetical protein